MHNISYKVALGGIISSLCLLCMFLTGIFPALYITLPMIAGVLMMIISIEVNSRWAFLTFIATSLLSVFVTFDKEAALLYIMLFGHYPIIKKYIDQIKIRLLRFITKIIIFNTCIISETFVTIKVLGISEFYEQMSKKGSIYIYGFLLLMNFVCLSYDYSLNGIFALYNKKLKPKLRSNY